MEEDLIDNSGDNLACQQEGGYKIPRGGGEGTGKSQNHPPPDYGDHGPCANSPTCQRQPGC